MSAPVPLEHRALLIESVDREELVPIVPPDTRMETLLTAREVACYLKLSKSKVYYMIQTKKIPHVRIGRNVRIKETDLKAWLETNTIKIPLQ